MKHIIAFFFWPLLLLGGYAAYEAHHFLSTPASDSPREIVVSIAPGATFDRVAWDLKKAGAITDVTRFRLLAQFKNSLGKVRAGEFALNTGWTPDQVLRQVTLGQPVLYRLSIREGLSWWETAREVEAQGFARYEDFQAVIHDPEFLKRHDIPFASAEGFLYPETYLMRKPGALDRAQAGEVAARLVDTFWKQTRPRWTKLPRKKNPAEPQPVSAPGADRTGPANGGPQRGMTNGGAAAQGAAADSVPDAPATPADIDPAALRGLVILASLVEKETAVPMERARVAGVYANRLRLGMLLQCDPTIIYGVGASFSGSILRSQLNDAANAYNTYIHPGLPPGPICSPGLAALEAASAPERHDFLYFVATGIDGGHSFSKNLGEHNKAVQIYRNRERKD